MANINSFDSESSVLRKVSVISVGEARGHGLLVDLKTLVQVKACAEAYPNGVKSKMGHQSGVDDIVGFLKNFRIEGQKLFADLHLLKSSKHYSFLQEIAEAIPETFGLSVSFSGVHESIGGKTYARCDELYSVDVVSEPAANSAGLFGNNNLITCFNATPGLREAIIQVVQEFISTELAMKAAAQRGLDIVRGGKSNA